MAENSDHEDRLRVLEEVTDAALGNLELGDFLRVVLGRARELFRVDTAAVLLHDPTSHVLTATAAAGIEEEVLQGVTVQFGDGFAGRIAETRQPVALDHVERTSVISPLLWERGLRSLLGVPMLARGELVGVLHIGSVKARHFTDSEIRLLQVVADQLALATQVEVSSAERSAAAALQRGLLPSRLPRIRGLEFAARYVPGAGKAVGGDWYDVFGLPGDRIGIVIGDVTGHGLGAAVIMGRLRSALRAYALDYDTPAQVLTKLHRKVTHFEPGAMATVAYGIVSASQRCMTLSLAGHPPPVLAVPGTRAELVNAPADLPIGLGLGFTTRRPRRDTRVDLPDGCLLAFYTDGLVERRGQLIDTCLRTLTAAITPDEPERVCSHVMSTLVGTREVHDDVALLVARRDPDSCS
ncbi:SpoIIE family protein phosphatase [Actinokineospora auranticolor]|uniref:GAF domain-containing protein n=1 Tax=Actinokineospora auranticolor TaxID=155976 RepID=A0A2S6GDN3_9PSEU|nr:GAF domain-containing SpoIIE family protein phosphatase [Actinokineospora auranticolor]PPK63241.1 GAF domain-containing protein [Actinokineospora auranticolor]